MILTIFKYGLTLFIGGLIMFKYVFPILEAMILLRYGGDCLRNSRKLYDNLLLGLQNHRYKERVRKISSNITPTAKAYGEGLKRISLGSEMIDTRIRKQFNLKKDFVVHYKDFPGNKFRLYDTACGLLCSVKKRNTRTKRNVTCKNCRRTKIFKQL